MVPPVIVVLKVTAAISVPWQMCWFATVFIRICGFTVTVKTLSSPVQLTPFASNVGLTLNVTVCGVVVVLFRTVASILPVPLVPMPVTLSLSRVQA